MKQKQFQSCDVIFEDHLKTRYLNLFHAYVYHFKRWVGGRPSSVKVQFLHGYPCTGRGSHSTCSPSKAFVPCVGVVPHFVCWRVDRLFSVVAFSIIGLSIQGALNEPYLYSGAVSARLQLLPIFTPCLATVCSELQGYWVFGFTSSGTFLLDLLRCPH